MGSRRSRLPGARARHVGCWLGACHDVVVPACRAVGMVGTGSFRPVAGTEPASRLLWRRSPPRATSSGRRGAESRSAKLYGAPSGSIVAALLTPRSGCGAPPSQPKQKLARASPGGYRRSGCVLFPTMRLTGSIISGGPVDFSWEPGFWPGFWPGFRFWLCRAWLSAGRWVAWVHQHMGWQGGASTWFNLDGVSSVELYKWRLRIDIA